MQSYLALPSKTTFILPYPRPRRNRSPAPPTRLPPKFRRQIRKNAPILHKRELTNPPRNATIVQQNKIRSGTEEVITAWTRNPSCDSFARGFKSHPLRQKPGSPQAFRAFFLLRKVSFKSTKCTFLTHPVFYERGFEKHFQPLYNANRYNRGWKHSDKKRKKYLSTYSTRSIAWQRIMANHTVKL